MRFFTTPTLILPCVVFVLLVYTLLTHDPSGYFLAILIGMGKMVMVSVREIRRGSFSLDYIAFLAMVLALGTSEYLAGAVIALMYTGGVALEAYASQRANASLAALLARLPKVALVKGTDEQYTEVALAQVPTNAIILVRTGELVPLDGFLASRAAVLNVANLTGEPLPETVSHGAVIKSGSINAGEAFELSVSGNLTTSTYAKIVDLVKNAEENQAPFVGLSSRANIPFTLLTLLIALIAFAFTHDVTRVLAVLVIATPCPLIIAAPVAFIGGLSRAAGRNTIIKTPGTLEAIAQVTTIFFDKTGTLTLGEPQLTQIEMLVAGMHEKEILKLAGALEVHSIHPLARAVITATKERAVTFSPALETREVLGKGIEGSVDGRRVLLAQAPETLRKRGGISLLLTEDERPLAVLHFADVLKEHASHLIGELVATGYTVAIVTGDKKDHAATLFHGLPITLYAGCTPEEKYRMVDEARARGEKVAMVGDGLNDAPALARADVGIVFSGTENSASIEAADVAILGHDVNHIHELFALSKRSVRIARESVFTGIALSTTGMLCAAGGLITPVQGAIIQEGIDVTVIVNALRTAFPPRRSA
ncbi:MAG: heavy metal translocating P-type ATPase [Patescibacteria group bacterium]